MLEEWRDVIGSEGFYRVSNLGNVATVSRSRRWSHHGRSGVYKTKTKLLKPINTFTGYPQVSVYKDGKQKSCHVHRLVAEAFLENPKNKPQVNHKNGIKDDNRLQNLEWVTLSEQMIHSYRVLGQKNYSKGRFGELHNTSKAVLQKDTDGVLIRRWGSGMDAVRAGFDSSCISRCCSGISKSHAGFLWEYETD